MSYCFTQERAWRGSKTGCRVRITCMASSSSAATGVPLGARRRTWVAIESTTRDPRLSPAYAPQTFKVNSKGVSPLLSRVNQELSRIGSTGSEADWLHASRAVVRDHSSPHCWTKLETLGASQAMRANGLNPRRIKPCNWFGQPVVMILIFG